MRSRSPARLALRQRVWLAVLATTTALTISACGQASEGSPVARRATASPGVGLETGGAPPHPPVAPLRAPAGRTVPPAQVEIPVIGVSSALVRLGLASDGTLQAPADYGTAGWYTGGPSPGQTGPAVIAGHLDSDRGPAVFYRIGSLRPDEAVLVVLADGKRLRFVVTGVASYPKDAFPTQAVYGPTPYPALRLITCGGPFDRSSGRYRHNVVVSARLLGS